MFKPLLASDYESLSRLNYPLWGSPKYDGIRVLCHPGFPVTRSLKEIRNRELFKLMSIPELQYFDGEICSGEPNHKEVFQKTQSHVMSFVSPISEPWKYYVFDYTKDPAAPFTRRFDQLREAVERLPSEIKDIIHVVAQHELFNHEDVERIEDHYVRSGYEGLMLRSPTAPYKFGRSTLKEHILLKMKRFEDDEATIIGFEELLSNQNTATLNELGYTERKGGSENMVPMGTLGAVIVECGAFPTSFNVGSGFTAAQRQEIWDNKDHYLGRMIKFKYQPVGIKEKPRLPIFLGFRDPE